MPPGWALDLAGRTPPEHECTLYDELVHGPIPTETLKSADLCAIGGLSPSRGRGYQLADQARSLGVPVVGGGIDLTGHYLEDPERNGAEILRHYDAFVYGRLTRRLWAHVLSLVEKRELRGLLQVEADEPWEDVALRHSLIKPASYVFPRVIRSSSGCPRQCGFCAVGLINGFGCQHPKDPGLLSAELQSLPPGREIVDSADACLAGASPKQISDVLGLLRDTGQPWYTETMVEVLLGSEGTPGLLEPMVRHGCEGFYVGLEDIIYPFNPKQRPVEQVERLIKEIHDRGCKVLGSFVLDGSRRATEDSIKRTIEWIIHSRLDFVQLSLLALVPGSPGRVSALKTNSLLVTNPRMYDGAWPTIEHQIPPDKRIELLMWGYRQVYSPLNIARRLGLNVVKQPIVALANAHIRSSIAKWLPTATYDYWEAHRHDPTENGG